MHDLEFEHLHVELDEVSEAAWTADNVELLTVGIDIGSSTSHLMFARVHLQRLGTALSSRFVVVERSVVWQSPILLTPYLPDYTINTRELEAFIARCYSEAGLDRAEVDSGAVVLTGEALKRKNARAIADLFSQEAGKFVCASAGHYMECQMAAHGSGAVRLSASKGVTVLNVDIGGGTTKFALVRNGQIVASAAIAVGGRLIVEDPQQGLTRIEGPAQMVAATLGVELTAGKSITLEDRRRMAARMARIVVGMIDLRQPGELARRLLVTDGWPAEFANAGVDALTFSGGVAEYLYRREQRRFGDLGSEIAEEIRHLLAHRRDLPPVWEPAQGIRATVIGAAQFSVQISGNTITITRPEDLPLHNLPVMAGNLELSDDITPIEVTNRFRLTLAGADFEEGTSPIALSFAWQGDPTHRRLRALAEGICATLPRTISYGLPIVLLIDGDIGMSLGRIIRNEVAPSANVLAIDGVQLKQFDFVDIGNVIEVTNVVPIIIKSLLFS